MSREVEDTSEGGRRIGSRSRVRDRKAWHKGVPLTSSFLHSQPPAPQRSRFGRPNHHPTLGFAKTSTQLFILANPNLTTLVFVGLATPIPIFPSAIFFAYSPTARLSVIASCTYTVHGSVRTDADRGRDRTEPTGPGFGPM